ncbi:sigma 54-interacting transcriptional regulator [Candidatus Nitrospira nitrificans]|uniref:Sigma-54 dependent transcriptional regulator (Modular protein) n=1 Tax=Candidatus Nitrospira nitrificans TaxID=1742973 RepID=A0A0S4LMB7_9BACT|nr:sigma 54-interacting transcriptional regulator [Candidatus Nitrospira nitrificans]CUS38727.1 Sigma-54 dependent transcriptional regulator (Modular protein) [Candidatus Nitrospira nitrificans]
MDPTFASPDGALTERHQALLEVAEAISAHRDLHELFRDLVQRLSRVMQVNFVSLSLHDPMRNHIRLQTIQANVPAELLGGHEEPVDETPAGLVFLTQRPVLVSDLAAEHRWPQVLHRMREDGVNSFCVVPLTTAVRQLGAMGFSSLRRDAYSESDVEFLRQVGKQVAVAVDNVLHHQDLVSDRDRLRLLLEVTESIALHHDADRFLRDLAQRLPRIVPFDYINIVLHDPAKNVMRLRLLVTSMPATIKPGLELPIEESPGGLVWKTQQPLTVPDIASERRFSKLIAMLRENGVQSFCVVPLTTANQRLGALGFGSLERRTYDVSEIEFMHQIAKQVAIAVENALNYERAQSTQSQLTRERDHQRLLLEVNNAVITHLDLNDLFTAVSECLRKVIQHDGSSLLLCDERTGEWRIHVLDFQRNESFIEEGTLEESTESPSCLAINTGKAALFREPDLKEMASSSPCAQNLLDRGVKSFCSLPLLAHKRALGALNVGRRRDDGFTSEDVELLGQVAQQVAIAVENALAYKQIAQLKDKLTEEKLYLEEEIQTNYNFEEIVGESRALKQVLKQIETVAPTDSTVLILGETGSGKELVARALHNLSTRRERTFVKLNCAAIPTGLLESELFGHEKGAFTGAIATKVGRFELADRGTLFLDEVGEIPLELQVKLLRVLQEQEFERLGGTRTIRTNVRVVAATNRDLDQMVDEQKFRSDLYYRLKVFPVTVPPLRERVEDISVLARHFAHKFAMRMKKRVETIPVEAMKAMQAYPWPGNVRELGNFIERAVILSTGSDLVVQLSELKSPTTASHDSVLTLEAAERKHILHVLRDSKWTLGGPGGAAARLGMKRTTLHSKMRKLGIVRPS